MNNSRCNCCDKSYGNFGCSKGQGGYDSHDSYKKNACKCCCFCWEDGKDDYGCGKEKEKDFSKCGCSHTNNINKGFDCGCGSQTKGYDYSGFDNTGKNNYYGW